MLLSRRQAPPQRPRRLQSLRTRACASSDAGPEDGGEDELMAVRTPLRWVGPYPALALSFPELATPNMKERGDAGVSLDFVSDFVLPGERGTFIFVLVSQPH